MAYVVPPKASGVTPTSATVVGKFSKTLALTYMGQGFWSLILVIASLTTLHQALVTRRLMLLMPHLGLLGLSIALIYLMVALHRRRNWARYAAVIFWVLCLMASVITITRNGLYPEAPAGPLKYSNAAEISGARFATFVTPLLLVILESTAIYGLLFKSTLVAQFKRAPKRVET